MSSFSPVVVSIKSRPRFTTINSHRPDRYIVIDQQTQQTYGAYWWDQAQDVVQNLCHQHGIKTEPCWQCGVVIESDGEADPHLCPACQRMAADSALNELAGHAKRLIAGEAPFDQIEPSERLEQLVGLVGFDYSLLPVDLLVDIAGKCADEIARRMGSIVMTAPAKIRSVLAGQPTKSLTCPEGTWRGGEAPLADVRDELESRIERDEDVPPADDVPVIIRFPAMADEPPYRPAA
jgi:hypothetical protein